MSFKLPGRASLGKTFRDTLWRHKLHITAGVLIGVWCLPYITTGDKVEWGDFGLFAHGYEAIRVTVLQYHQFPWFDPWIAGGVPLYANPQIGVFSIQTLLVFLFGAARGLKYALIIYTYAGYASMYVLARYLKIDKLPAILISLLWIFCSFFVSHLPSHYTFVWYMLSPFFVYLSLRLRGFRSGLIFGAAFAVMGLSQIHNSFFQIAVVCGVIIAIRLYRSRSAPVPLLKACAGALLMFAVLAGHRLILTVENVKDFPRAANVLLDPSAGFVNSVLSIILPFSPAHAGFLGNFISYPVTHYGWGEQTMTLGVFASICFLLCCLYYMYARSSRQAAQRYKKLGLLLLLLGAFFFVLGIGAFWSLSPYSILRHLPVLGDLRVSSRWFLWTGLSCLIFIGVTISAARKKSFIRFAALSLLGIAVLEVFLLNVGYQSKVLTHSVIKPKYQTSHYTFQQTSEIGQSYILPDNKGTIPNDGNLPHFYREYEATMFNLGTLQANDALVNLNTLPTPRCSYARGCNLVLSGNAKVVHWSPNKLILQRTGPGDIVINENNSNYFVINGKRNNSIKVAEPYKDFVIRLPDSEQQITIQAKPSITLNRLKNTLH